MPEQLAARLPTPLEASGHTRISYSPEIDAWLAMLVAAASGAQLAVCGHSLRGQPLSVLHCGVGAEGAAAIRPKVLLVGSQHGGSEAAGCEALLVLARRLLLGDLAPLRHHLDILILANANPDGRDADSNRNANGVNLNRDHVLLSQPETRALTSLLRAERPAVVLDAHESAALKRRTLWREGWLTEFEAQFDVATHPAIPRPRRVFGEARLLAPWCAQVSAGGLAADRYIREILSTSQALTHGGVTIRGLRNKAGVLGSLSFLLETRLDPKDGNYRSYRNIAVRVAKQLTCMEAFLGLLRDQAATIASLARLPRAPVAGQPLALGADYAPVAHAPVAHIPLRRAADGERVLVPFADHRRLVPRAPVRLPPAYLVTRHAEVVASVLARHGLAFETLAASTLTISAAVAPTAQADLPATLRVDAGTLRVPTAQTDGLLVPLLLEAHSHCNLFAHSEYAPLVRGNAAPFIYRSA